MTSSYHFNRTVLELFDALQVLFSHHSQDIAQTRAQFSFLIQITPDVPQRVFKETVGDFKKEIEARDFHFFLHHQLFKAVTSSYDFETEWTQLNEEQRTLLWSYVDALVMCAQ